MHLIRLSGRLPSPRHLSCSMRRRWLGVGSVAYQLDAKTLGDQCMGVAPGILVGKDALQHEFGGTTVFDHLE